MSMGFQAFIKGTSFDVLNSMSYNFVADITSVSGSGSITYSLPGFVLSASLINTYNSQGTDARSYQVSVSGQTVSWNVANACKMLVTATPDVSAASKMYFGFSLYDYSTSPRTFKIAPDFTPYNLVQVIDITPGYDQVFQTNIPASVPMIAFHRALGNNYDHVWWNEIQQNGYWALQFRGNTGLFPMQTCRIYLFAKYLVNTPGWGFFLYRNGALVWHNNCLPLNMTVLNGGTVTSSHPLAVTNGVTGCFFLSSDPAFPGIGTQWFNCASGGMDTSGNYAVTTLDRYQQAQVTGSSRPNQWSAGTVAYTDCYFYDAYYRQALGV
ncbi:hypothetical protein [Pantoea sp.]|uniref:hypothetical protein n=1 Tax=Pantoea sp. TaxID=69393 RepID=UPI00289D3DC8|nr:hypothetical protein [Pantoea sp.]